MTQPNLLFIMAVSFALIAKLTFYECTSLSSSCQPAEEGHRTSIVFRKSFHQQNIIITVERFNYTIARCDFPGNCRDFFPKDFRTTLNVNNTSFDVTITVSVFNTSREIEKYWNLVHKKIVSTCHVLVFARAQLISCSEAISKEGLHISCWSSSIYPEANARISINFPRVGKLISVTKMNFVNQKLPGDPTYYRPNCSLTISVDKLIPGQYDIALTLYPNVTGSDTDITFGTNHSFHINLDFIKLKFKDYPKIFEKKLKLTYECKRSNSGLFKIASSSFDHNNITGNEARTIQTYREAYYCVETSALGLAKAFYSPTTITKTNSLNCTTSEVEGILLVTCTTNGIHPQGFCQVMINKTMQKILRNSKVKNVEETPDNQTTYWSTCEFNITKIELSHFEIIVTMYPNVTGDDSDKQFGANQSISINLAL